MQRRGVKGSILYLLSSFLWSLRLRVVCLVEVILKELFCCYFSVSFSVLRHLEEDEELSVRKYIVYNFSFLSSLLCVVCLRGILKDLFCCYFSLLLSIRRHSEED